MTSDVAAKRMTASPNRSEEISPETFARWTEAIPNAIRAVLHESSDPARLVSRNGSHLADPQHLHRAQDAETADARLRKSARELPKSRGTGNYPPETILRALIAPLAAEGAAIFAVGERGDAPVC